MTEARYAYQQAWPGERARLAGAEALWDDGSRALLADRVRPGAAVLEVGAGSGSLVPWLADAVGPVGRVLALDLDARFISALASENVEVREADVVDTPLAECEYDIVHARLLLEHLAQRAQVLDRLVAALRPGGWLLVEDYDFTSFGWEPSDELGQRASDAVLSIMSRGGFDPAYGRRLVGELSTRGLSDVSGSGRSWVIDATHPGYAFFRLSFEQLVPAILAAGLLDEAGVTSAGARLVGGAPLITPTLFSVSGRR